MTKLKGPTRSPHIQLALVTGASIIAMAYVSKRVLPEPMTYLSLAIPPFIATIWGSAEHKHKGSRACRVSYWATAIVLATAMVILHNLP
ncbi:hypothetical protein KKG45_06940 [bacterium]|nr:hypothetical protein [bacterium]MBU1072965.1 hypothetical protein [bacterium]MBU1675972.1 hypothetical protein [bacterium]